MKNLRNDIRKMAMGKESILDGMLRLASEIEELDERVQKIEKCVHDLPIRTQNEDSCACKGKKPRKENK